jgi:hypothetical protein
MIPALMKLKTWLDQLPEEKRDLLLVLCDTTKPYLCYQVANGHRSPSRQLAARIVEASKVLYPRCKRKRLTLVDIYS